jgi:hypothetical protein
MDARTMNSGGFDLAPQWALDGELRWRYPVCPEPWHNQVGPSDRI